jgi:NADH-ubiquinone oxidoreductase chain 3
MNSLTFFIVFIPILAIILLAVNFLLAPHLPYIQKADPFECGFTGFQMTRNPFNVSFFIYALLFLLFDLEILLVYPYVVSAYVNNIYGLIFMLIFFILLTVGFTFEIGKNALQLESRQFTNILNKNSHITLNFKNRE